MDIWNALNELSGLGRVGATVIVASLITCIVACVFVVYDTVRDTYKTVDEMWRNRKSKN